MKLSNKELLKQSLSYVFILGLIAHGYCFLNTIMSHDALNNIYIATKWNRLRAGRFFYPIYLDWIRGRILLPWLIGILSLIWISLAVYMIVKMFQIEKRVIIAAVAGICVTNPTVYSIAATYLHDLDADMFAMLCSVLGAYLWSIAVEKKNVKCKITLLGAGAFAVSVAVGIYQSFLSVTIVLIMLVCIKNLLEKKDFRYVFIRGISGIGMLVLTAVFYLIEIVFFSKYTGISIMENSDYNSLGNVAGSLSNGLIGSIASAYLDFIHAFKDVLTTNGDKLFIIAHVVIAALIVAIAVVGIIKMQWNNRVLIVLLGVLMPLAMNVTYVLSGGVIHDLMRYAFWYVYLVALVFVLVFDKKENISFKKKQCIYIATLVSVFVVIFGNIQTSNAVYMKKHLEYQGTLSYMTRVADRIEEHEEYQAGETPVLFVGEDVLGVSRYGFEQYENITGVASNSPLTFYDTYEKYFKYILGLSLNYSEDSQLRQDERVREMPVFPKEGSVTMIDGTMVVKLGE